VYGTIIQVNTLPFIDSMTGRLAWPIAALILGLVFRGPLTSLMNRVRRVRWGEREAELADTADVQEAIEELAKPLPESGGRARARAARPHPEPGE
jgi:hypothetical protein